MNAVSHHLPQEQLPPLIKDDFELYKLMNRSQKDSAGR
jgi:hypothetical protein